MIRTSKRPRLVWWRLGSGPKAARFFGYGMGGMREFKDDTIAVSGGRKNGFCVSFEFEFLRIRAGAQMGFAWAMVRGRPERISV